MSDTPDTAASRGNYEGYVFDAENAAEMARLMVQDQVITQAMGGPLPEQPDLSGIFHALDIACGPGGWLFDVASRYPHIQAVGIDKSQLMIEYASHLAASQKLSNLRFRVMDATRPLAFPDQTFDLVNARLLVGVLLKEQWPALLAECFRILKPGGILRLTEAEWGFTNGPTYDTCTRLAFLGGYRSGHSFSPHGRTCGVIPMLRPLMQRAGYQVLGQRAYAVDYSAGTVAHHSNVQNLLVSYKLLQPFLVHMQVATQEELDQLHAHLEGELLADDFCAIDYYLTVWGRKPESSL